MRGKENGWHAVSLFAFGGVIVEGLRKSSGWHATERFTSRIVDEELLRIRIVPREYNHMIRIFAGGFLIEGVHVYKGNNRATRV